jgi:ketosteroid isomerase-like protein
VSQENVEIVRGMYEAFNRGDFEGSTQTLHPAAELHQPLAMADSDSYYGRDEFVRGLAVWLSAWEEPRFEPLDADAAGEHVIMHVRVTGRGKTSGIRTEAEFFHAWTLSDGQPHRCFVRSTRAEALKAVGLED